MPSIIETTRDLRFIASLSRRAKISLVARTINTRARERQPLLNTLLYNFQTARPHIYPTLLSFSLTGGLPCPLQLVI